CTAVGKRLGMELSRLQAICDYYHLFFKALNWYNQVLDQLSFKDSFWKENPLKDSDARPLAHTSLLWRRQCQIVLSQMPPQKPSEWAELITLSKLIPENQKTQGIQLASRGETVTCCGPQPPHFSHSNNPEHPYANREASAYLL
ncbi:Hypothetical predicted protein, partial [Pelobates cultripes]